MSPPIQLNTQLESPYTPVRNGIDRHDYGVSKNRKVASTGGGRAWSEEEEVYLLQTRLQKMPYKHIAAHLKKTELACRLHYHQLSHGSNRRKRTASVSSGSSISHSPSLPMAMPSPIRECTSRDTTPPSSAGHHGSGSPGPIQLPGILAATGTSPRLPAILPKPAAMQYGAPMPLGFLHSHSSSDPLRSLGPSPFPRPLSANQPSTLRLETSTLQSTNHVDMSRLNAIYESHRSSFWSIIATDYGTELDPATLEKAWKTGIASPRSQTPITPITSPTEREPPQDKTDRTRISAILGIDADPRSPKEREMVRRLEEERGVGLMAGA